MILMEQRSGISYVDIPASGDDVEGVSPTLLLLHGLGNSHSYWSGVLEGLSATARCIALDIPGFGGSAARAEKLDLRLVSEQIALFESELGLGEVVIVAHSMGGFVAMQLASHPSSNVESLILVDATLWRAYGVLRGDRSITDDWSLTSSLGAQFVGGMLPFKKTTARLLGASRLLRTVLMWPFMARSADVDEDLLRSAMEGNRGGCALLSAALAPRKFDLDTLVSKIACPVYSLRGCKDHLINDEDIAWFAKHVAEFKGDTRLPDVGHWPMIEAPDELVRSLRNILK